MGDRFSFVRIMQLGLGGAVGGLITFGALNQLVRGQAPFGDGDATQHWITVGTVVGAVIGLTIGACLIAAEEWHTRSATRIARRSAVGAVAGIFCGALGGLDGYFVFTTFQGMNVVLARCAGLALIGAGAGICPGLVSRSYFRAQLGAFGGLIGGAVGGLVFDALAVMTGSAVMSMALGFVLVGAAIGVAVGFLEEAAKTYWLTILTGSKEGQSFPLSKDETTIGRDETVDIPLFGDNAVQHVHSRIIKSSTGVCIIGSPVLVNSQSTASSPLSAGDVITIGKHRLRFGARRSTRAANVPAFLQQAPPVAAPQSWQTATVMSPPVQQAPTATAASLQVISGPHVGAVLALSAATVSIGRAPDCSIALPNDHQVSRRHAQIAWDGSCRRIEDCGSTNGVFVNGRRVSAQAVRPNDQITVGQSVLRVL